MVTAVVAAVDVVPVFVAVVVSSTLVWMGVCAIVTCHVSAAQLGCLGVVVVW
jgi:hypothetical protein